MIYDCNKYEDTPSVKASMRMFDAAGVNYHQYHRTDRKVTIELVNARHLAAEETKSFFCGFLSASGIADSGIKRRGLGIYVSEDKIRDRRSLEEPIGKRRRKGKWEKKESGSQ